MILRLVHIFIHVLDIINSMGRNICTIEGADWHREEYYVQKKTDGGRKVAFHRYVSGTKHREMHFQTCRVTYHIILDGIYRGASTMELFRSYQLLLSKSISEDFEQRFQRDARDRDNRSSAEQR